MEAVLKKGCRLSFQVTCVALDSTLDPVPKTMSLLLGLGTLRPKP